ncbi:MAG: hypothetical protein INR66_27085 [Gordonia polyisoprenivorans]|nr:hypothetical protein [Gordonia polyisoprenivorans]
MTQNPGTYPSAGQGFGAPATAAPSAGGLVGSAAIQGLGGVIAIVGVFLSWLTITVQGVTVTVNGFGSVSGGAGDAESPFTGSSHGIRALIFGIIVLVGAIVVIATKKAPTSALGLVGGALLVVFGLIDFFDIKGEIDSAPSSIEASVGIGLWLVIIGGAIGLIGALIGLVAGRRKV